jgi:threonine synthase
MKYYSTSNKNEFVSLKEAVLKGTGKNDGLYLPEKLPLFEQELTNVSYHEMAFEILNPFVNEDINKSTLENIVKDTFNFPVKISSFNNEHFLELFHGPTLAFKDFGARFLANIIEEFNKDNSTKLNVLVATSGDTGSAVANAFYGKESVNVIVLYPSNGVSEIQEKQIATFDKNIIALEVKGSFDDCQSLLKNALNDDSIKGEFKLTTANSINIARLLPQTIYYFEALRQLNLSGKTLITVPSGNLGNLTAGLLAKLMGQKIDGFVSAVNDNKFFKLFLDEEKEDKLDTIKTYSNAMDVGFPNNLKRVKTLFNNNIKEIKKSIKSYSINDHQTINSIKYIYDKHNYIIDPHTAVGYQASLIEKSKYDNSIVLSTAHPAKFKEIIESNLNIKIELPSQLSTLMNKEKRSIIIENDYQKFKELLFDYSSILI